MDLLIRHELRDGVDVISLAGDLDVRSAAILREALKDLIGAQRHDLVVDLGRVAVLESMGMGVLMGALRLAHLHGGTVELVGLSAVGAKALRMAGLASAFDVHPQGSAGPPTSSGARPARPGPRGAALGRVRPLPS